MKIKNSMPFVIDINNSVGIATELCRSSMAWRLSDELFTKICDRAFSWTGPNGKNYVDDKANFRRPTEEEIIAYITQPLKEKAIESGLIEE